MVGKLENDLKFLLVNHFTKTIHYDHQHQQHLHRRHYQKTFTNVIKTYEKEVRSKSSQSVFALENT